MDGKLTFQCRNCGNCTETEHAPVAGEVVWCQVFEQYRAGALPRECQYFKVVNGNGGAGLGVLEFDLVAHLHRQRAFSEKTFGSGERTQGLVKHIIKELAEVLDAPHDLEEWVDVVLLALDGAWRAGFEPEAIALGISAKQSINEGRDWPDWRTCAEGRAIEHIKQGGAA